MGESAVARKRGVSMRTTAAWREWLGWTGILMWMYMLINDYSWYSSYASDDIFWSVLAFELLFGASIFIVSFFFGRNPNALGKIAAYTTPVAMLLTAVFSFLPTPFHSVAYALSPIFIAPALARTVYSVIQSAHPKYAATTYMSGIATAYCLIYLFFLFEDYYIDILLINPPSKILYACYGLLLVPAWLAARRAVVAETQKQESAKLGLSKKLVFMIAVTFIVMSWLRQMTDYTNFAVEQFDDILFTPLYRIMPFFTYVALGFAADKKRERSVVLGGLMLHLVSILLALLLANPGSDRNAAVVPLLFTNRFMSLMIEYFMYSIPVYFFLYVKRPVLAASAGTVAFLFCRALSWAIRRILPDMLQDAGAPLFVSAGIATILFLLLLHYILERQKEKTLAAAL